MLKLFYDVNCRRTIQLLRIQSVYSRQHDDIRLLLQTLRADKVHPVWSCGCRGTVL